MPRQVRLDDDVADLVEQYQEAEGLKSLSSSANRMLRLAAGPEEDQPDPAPLEPAMSPVVTIAPPSRRRTRLAARVRATTPAARPLAEPPARPTPPAAAPTTPACPHPLLLRHGPVCGRCGVTV